MTQQFKYCPCCGKFLPLQQLEPEYQVCTSCGWTNKEVITVNNPQPRFTIPARRNFTKMEKLGNNFSMGCGMSILLILLGCVLLLIPIIGWIIGGLLIWSGLGAPFAALTGSLESLEDDYELTGDCPYCNNFVKVPIKSKVETTFVKCEVCQEKILIKKDIFYTIIKRYSA